MYSLEDVRREYERLDSISGLDTSMIELKLSKRAVKQLGCFRFPRQGGRDKLCISLSALIMDDEALFYDTIRHEYAHAAVYLMYPMEQHGHDEVWKNMCRLVGCRPRSRTSLSEETAKARESRAKYIVRCEGCGSESAYLRRGKVVDALLSGKGRRLRCSRCGGNSISLTIK